MDTSMEDVSNLAKDTKKEEHTAEISDKNEKDTEEGDKMETEEVESTEAGDKAEKKTEKKDAVQSDDKKEETIEPGGKDEGETEKDDTADPGVKDDEEMEEGNTAEAVDKGSEEEDIAEGKDKKEKEHEEDATVVTNDDKKDEDAQGSKHKKRGEIDMPPEITSGKRARKSAERFESQDFSSNKKQVNIIKGRGKRLAEIQSVRESIESVTMNSTELNAAHKFIFSVRGKVPNKDKKGHLLDFSGFLEPKVSGEDKAKREKADEDAEAKMSTKAFKLTIPEIKTICDFFTVDRSSHDGKPVDKEALVDRLLDFLGSPHDKHTKGGKKTVVKSPKTKADATPAKKATPKSPKTKAETTPAKKKKTPTKKEKESDDDGEEVEEQEEEEEGEDEKEKEVSGDGMPNDSELRSWVRAYVQCFNLDKATTKHAVETASEKFGVNLNSKKARIKELLTEEM